MLSYKKITHVLALATLISVASMGVAIAHEGIDHSHSETTVKNHSSRQEARTELKQKYQTEAQATLRELKASRAEAVKTRTAAMRQQACENRKKGITTKANNIVKNGEKYLGLINKALAKAEAFKTAQTLTVENYDALLAVAQAAKEAATESLVAAKELVPNIDCTQTDASQTVATFKAAASELRGDLKEYKQAVKDLLRALRDAKSADANPGNNEGSEQ